MRGRQLNPAKLVLVVHPHSLNPTASFQQRTLPAERAVLFTFLFSVFFTVSKNKSSLVWMGENT